VTHRTIDRIAELKKAEEIIPWHHPPAPCA